MPEPAPMPAPALSEYLYFSVLADGQSPGAVARILARARPFNAANDITGLLVFDGQRFCQHLEGPDGPLDELMARIEADLRHRDVRVVHNGPLTQRRYRRFDMGYAQSEDPQELDRLFDTQGADALSHFLALKPTFDIQA